MNKTFIISILLLALHFSVNAFAENTTHSNMTAQGESEKNRSQKDIGFSIIAIDGQTAPGSSLMSPLGVNLSFYINANSILILDAGKGHSGNFISSLFGVQDMVDMTRYGLQYQSFFGNSAFIKVGVQQRDLVESKSGAFLGVGIGSRQLNATVTDFIFKLGNQWQWKSFNFGIDWIGISLPISGQITQDSLPIASRPQSDSDVDELLHKGTFSLFTVSMGFCF